MLVPDGKPECYGEAIRFYDAANYLLHTLAKRRIRILCIGYMSYDQAGKCSQLAGALQLHEHTVDLVGELVYLLDHQYFVMSVDLRRRAQ